MGTGAGACGIAKERMTASRIQAGRPRPGEDAHLLVARLERSRTLTRRNLWIRGALPAAAGVALLSIALRIAAATSIPLGGAGADVPASLLVVGLAALVSGAAVAVWVRRTTPTLVELGIRADRALAAQERISTAVELLGRGSERSMSRIAHLAVEDAYGFADRVDPAGLAPAVRRRTWGLLALCAVAVVAAVVVPVPALTLSPGAVGANDQASSARAAVQARDIKAAAVLVQKDAKILNDRYLAAAAKSLASLGDRVAKGTISSTVAASQVAQLEHLLAQAYQRHGGGMATLDAQGPTSGQPKPTSAASKAPQAGATAGAQQSAAPVVSMKPWSSAQSGPSTSLSNFVRQLESGTPAAPAGSTATRSRSGKATSPALSSVHQTVAGQLKNSYYIKDPRQAKIDQMQAMYAAAGQPNGQPVGPAQQSNRGAGDAAGHGSQPLAGAASKPLPAAAGGKGATVTLPSNPSAKGNEIHVKAAPDTHHTSVVDVVPGPVAAGAKASETPVLVGPLLDRGMRLAVGRFFLPSNGPDTTSPSSSVPGQ